MGLEREPLNDGVVNKIVELIKLKHVDIYSGQQIGLNLLNISEFIKELDCSGRELQYIYQFRLNRSKYTTFDKKWYNSIIEQRSNISKIWNITTMFKEKGLDPSEYHVIMCILHYVFPWNTETDLAQCVIDHSVNIIRLRDYTYINFTGNPTIEVDEDQTFKPFTEFSIEITPRKMTAISNLLKDAIRYAKEYRVSIHFRFNGHLFDISPIANYDLHMKEYNKHIEIKSQ